MSFPVVALVLGSALLIVAAGLLLRAYRQERGPGVPEKGTGPSDRTGAPRTHRASRGRRVARAPRDRHAPRAARESHASQPVRAVGDHGDAAGHGTSAPAGTAGTVGSGDPAGTTSPADDRGTAVAPRDGGTAAPVTGAVPAPAAPSDGASFTGRRGRRHWAAARGFEYTRDDAFLTAEWPVSLLREISPTDAGPTARDLVSGFVDGHQLHIADVAGATLLALRRGAYSPVDVHLSTVAAMPAGMRHDTDLDRPPFTVYTTDPRAAGRWADSRVDAALAGLAGKVSDIALSGAWVVARCPKRTDPDLWDALLPSLVALGTAARVLPPLVTSATLDIATADPTRPRPASGARVRTSGAAGTAGAHAAPEEDDRASSRPGHLRAVPDVPEPPARDTAPQTPEPPAETRPTVERSTDPVEFPTRSQGRVLGDADLDGAWPEDVAEDGLTSIPALGEEPSPHPGPGPGDPRIMRTGDAATIFADGPGMGAGIGDPEPRKGGRRRLRGRHRGPDARHAGADDVDGTGDYDVVDPEVVDPED